MLFDDAINHFGSKTAVAEALDIHKSALSRWGYYVPKNRARDLNEITKGQLKYDKKFYNKLQKKLVGDTAYTLVTNMTLSLLTKAIQNGETFYFELGPNVVSTLYMSYDELKLNFRTRPMYRKAAN